MAHWPVTAHMGISPPTDTSRARLCRRDSASVQREVACSEESKGCVAHTKGTSYAQWARIAKLVFDGFWAVYGKSNLTGLN